MKAIGLLLCVLCLCLIVNSGFAQESGYSGSVSTVIVTDNPTTHHTNLYMGIELGIFKKHGINVQYLKQLSPDDAFKAMIDGKADMLFACPTATIVQISKGAPLKIVSQIKSPCTSILTVPMDSDIKTIADLKGKKVTGISPTCEAIIAFRDVASKEEADFEIIKANPKDAMGMLEKGEVDACILEEPFASVMQLKGYELKFREVIQVPCRFLSASNALLQKDPDAVKRFVEALEEINEIYAKDPTSDQVVAIAVKYTGASEEAVRKGQVRIHFTTILNVLRIQALEQSLIRLGVLKEQMKDEDLFAKEMKGITW